MTVPGLFWVASLCIYVLMYALMCIRPGMTMNFGFHEVKSMLDCGRE